MASQVATALAGSLCIPARHASAKQAVRPAFSAGALRAVRRSSRPQSASQAVRIVAAAAVDVKELNAKYGKPGSVELKDGRGGLPTVVLKHACGSSAEVTLFGGCVTSWKTSDGTELLYIRPDAVFDKSKPISGGVPHCFPQFGPGAIQLHGFARNVDWELVGASAEGNPEVQLVLQDNDYTRSMWPHAFKVVYTITLDGEQLRTDMRVNNTGHEPFHFTASLHTYFGVTDIDTAAVQGLKGLEYLDRVADAKHPTVHQELRDAVTFTGPVDAVYRGAKAAVTLGNGKGTVTLSSSNWSDMVLWTPWTAMEACYREFVCLENAQFGAVTVQPGQSWNAKTKFSFSVDPLELFCGDNPDADECKVFDD